MLGNFSKYKVLFAGNKLQTYQKKLIEKNHYSKTARSQLPTHIFELLNEETGEIIGIALYGIPCGSKVRQKYGEKCVELRRLVVIDRTLKNTTSWFLSRTIKYLKAQTFVTGIISYSDPNQGHTGAIYKACNFEYLGKELGLNPRIYMLGKKKIHQRMMYQKKNGEYVPSALKYQYLLATKKIRKVKQLNKDRFFMSLQR